MNIEEITLKCVKAAANLFKDSRDPQTLQAHGSLNALHKHYRKAFKIIEERQTITKNCMGNVAIYTFQPSKGFTGSCQVIKSQTYICNCSDFSSRDFQYCSHILATMIAEELKICSIEFSDLNIENYIDKINNFS